MINNCFSVISLGLITIRARGLPITSLGKYVTAFLLSIVNLLLHVHMFRLYFTAFLASETCKLLLTQHMNLCRQSFALKSAKSAEFILYLADVFRLSKGSSAIDKLADIFWQFF